eukprot:CAMPEP_0119055248 /NCGR_PEP_ID=MMETSP1177-20130426/75603_1 /TAXON_ID=2985 /ORGANISM="Ochromonas sp, Strain CCMP1899" /LENGTH=75 /DNA_ID=CAMNT_0007035739 /DNA_START=848 /DNA_END=1075 /DNA_ORIENTATION=-
MLSNNKPPGNLFASIANKNEVCSEGQSSSVPVAARPAAMTPHRRFESTSESTDPPKGSEGISVTGTWKKALLKGR